MKSSNDCGYEFPPRIEPEPLARDIAPPQPYPVDALGEVLGNATRQIMEAVQAPDGLCGQAMLSAASLAVQAHVDVIVDGRIEPTSLWCLTVGESGERKSGVYKWALEPHRQHEKKRIQAYQKELKLYKAKMGEKDRNSSRAASLSGHEAPLDRQKNFDQESLDVLDPPLSQLVLLQEGTLEGIYKNLIHGQPSIGLFSDDGAELFSGFTMNRENKAKSAAGFSKLWDEGEFSRVRSIDGAGKHYGKRMSLHMMVQPLIAENILGDELLNGQGFLGRCLLAWPKSTMGSRMYREVDPSESAALQKYWNRVLQLLDKKPSLSEGTRNELSPRKLTLSDEAKEFFIQLHNDIESKIAHEYANIKAYASKAGSQALRTAGVLTIFDDPDAVSIDLDTMQRAGILTNFYLNEAVRLFGISSIPRDLKDAKCLIEWMISKGKSITYSSEIIQFGPSQLRTKSMMQAAIKHLEQSGYLTPIVGGDTVDGKFRKYVWRLNPLVANGSLRL